MKAWTKKHFEHVDWWWSNQITITGLTAAGTSSTLTALRRRHENNPTMKFRSAGEVVDHFARQMGLERDEFTRYMNEHPEERYDQRIDDTQRTWFDSNNVICESRLSHLWGSRACNILQVCDLPIRAERRARQEGRTIDDALKRICERDARNAARFNALYPGWDWPATDFAGVVNSGVAGNNPKRIAEAIEDIHRSWLSRIPRDKIRYMQHAP